MFIMIGLIKPTNTKYVGLLKDPLHPHAEYTRDKGRVKGDGCLRITTLNGIGKYRVVIMSAELPECFDKIFDSKYCRFF